MQESTKRVVFDDGESFNQRTINQGTFATSWRYAAGGRVCVVAAFSVLGLLIIDFGPWNKPKMQSATTATYSTTGEAARATGATITPTEPQSAIEPLPASPKPVHPVTPRGRFDD
jgi:hypothetical protein